MFSGYCPSTFLHNQLVWNAFCCEQVFDKIKNLKLENMKKILLLLIVISLTSCSKKFDLDQLPQEWKLVTIIATRLVPSIATEPQIIWQETYSLNSNGTFTKTRNRDGIITTASGTFAFKDS